MSALAARPKPEDHCSFCGAHIPRMLFRGPRAQICEQCVRIAGGMFFVYYRDLLPWPKSYREIFRRAVSDYQREEGDLPRVARRASS